jgi:hypothetical protein
VQPFVDAPQPCAPLFAGLLLLEACRGQVLRTRTSIWTQESSPFLPHCRA